MQELIADLARRLEFLEAENRMLAGRVRELESGDPGASVAPGLRHGAPEPGAEGDARVSRRGLLVRLGTAAAAVGGTVVGTSVLGARPAAAGTGPLQYGSLGNDAGGDATALTSANASYTFAALNTADDGMAGLWGELTDSTCSGAGVYGVTVGTGHGVLGVVDSATASGTAVQGVTYGTGHAVRAACDLAGNTVAAVDVSHMGSGAGVHSATIDGPAFRSLATGTGHGAELQVTGSGTGLVVDQQGTGRGVVVNVAGESNANAAARFVHGGRGKGVDVVLTDNSSKATGVQVSTAGSGKAVHARTTGAGNAVHGYVDTTSNAKAAVLGQTRGPGAGVEGTSSLGVGGRFSGKTAQVRLAASGASSHPASGVKGDHFVDKSGRLWFCKGGSTWKQLA